MHGPRRPLCEPSLRQASNGTLSVCKIGSGSTLLLAFRILVLGKKECQKPRAACLPDMIRIEVRRLAGVPPVLAGLTLLVYNGQLEAVHAIVCNTTQATTMQENAIQCIAIQYHAMRCNTMQCNAMQCNPVQFCLWDSSVHLGVHSLIGFS